MQQPVVKTGTVVPNLGKVIKILNDGVLIKTEQGAQQKVSFKDIEGRV